MKKLFKKIIIFGIIFIFVFFNFVSFLPQVLQNNKLAESLKVKEAYAAVAWRATGAETTGTGAVTPALPTGVATNDIVLLVASTIAGGTVTITASGSITTWTALTGSPIDVTSGEKLYVWWGRYSSGATGPTVTPGSDHIEAATIAYSGAITSGSPIDVSATGTETVSDTTLSFTTGISSTVDNTVAILVSSNGTDTVTNGQYSAEANTSLTGIAERIDYNTNSGGGGGILVAEGTKAIAGTLGTWTATLGTASTKAYIAFNLKPQLTTTIATESDPAATTIAPGAAATDVDLFTLQTNLGTETVSSVTVNLSTNSGVGTLAITDNANTVLGSIGGGTGSGIVTGSNTITVSGMSAGTTATTFKVRATPLAHTSMSIPPGASYAITAPVTAWVGAYTDHQGSDTNTNALTIDNTSPAGTTGAGATSGEDSQSVVSWTNPGDADFQQVYVYCKTATMGSGEAPTEGTDPTVDGTACGATAKLKYKGTVSPQTITGLTNGTTYYFRIYGRDTNGNFTAYSATQEVTGTPSALINTLTIGATSGAATTTIVSGDTSQYMNTTSCSAPSSCAAFTLSVSNTSVTVSSIKITEASTTNATADLSQLALFYDTDGNYSNGVTGQYGATVASFTSEAATVSGSLALTAGTTYYFYVRFNASSTTPSYPKSGQQLQFRIVSNTDVTLSSGSATITGAPATLAGTTTIKPRMTSITYGSGLSDGARSSEAITISGYGFGAAPGGSRANCAGAVDTGCVRFLVGGAATVADTSVSSWSNTSIGWTVSSTLATFGGASSLELVSGSATSTNQFNYYVYPRVIGMTTCSAGGARDNTCGTNQAPEYAAADTFGLIKLNGDHFGATAGTITFTGGITFTVHSTAEGACNVGGWAADGTSVCAEISPNIASSTNSGTITLTRNADSKTDTNAFELLPRITSATPTSEIVGNVVTIDGDHFCNVSSGCPASPPTSDYIVYFGTTQAISSDFVSSGNCSAQGTSWSNSRICVKVPSGTPTGSQNIKVVKKATPNQESERENFTVASTVPNDPTNLRQFKGDGTTQISVGGYSSSSNLYFKADLSASINIPMAMQIEVKASSTVFDETGIITGTDPDGACTLTPCQALISASILSSLTDKEYHWRARTKNTLTNEVSSWVNFSAGNVDFIVDTVAPTITSGPIATLSTNSASIVWGTTNELSTSQVQYQQTATACSSFSFASSCTTNNDCTTLDTAYVSNHTVNLINLNSGTSYCYRVRSKDIAGNEVIGINNGFQTGNVNNPAKTIQFFVAGATSTITSATTTYFNVLSPEAESSSILIKNAFIELIGLAKGGSNPITLQVNTVAPISYSVDATNSTYFRFIYKITDLTTNPTPENILNINNVSPCTNGNAGLPPCNKLIITPGSGMIIDVASARVILNYAYTP